MDPEIHAAARQLYETVAKATDFDGDGGDASAKFEFWFDSGHVEVTVHQPFAAEGIDTGGDD